MEARHEEGSADAYLAERLSLAGLRRAARGCRAGPLRQRGTRTVFGEGLKRARLMLVGEPPGDREDLSGRPFGGPAGDARHREMEGFPEDMRSAAEVLENGSGPGG